MSDESHGKELSSGIAFGLHVDIRITLETSLSAEHEQTNKYDVISNVFFYEKTYPEYSNIYPTGHTSRNYGISDRNYSPMLSTARPARAI